MFGIERVGAGEGGPSAALSSSALPVDIPYLKAVDWLVESRVVAKSWPSSLRTAQAKLEAALEAERPPAPGIDALLPAGRTTEDTTYFECARVLELLKEAGLGEKNFIGSFTNPHTARWADVVKRFESGSVFLVSAAQFLIHHVSYELPAIKKEMGRAERGLAELQRRQAEFVRMADASMVRYTQACADKKIGEGAREGIRQELRSSLAQLRPLYDHVARLAQQPQLIAASDAYKALVTHVMAKAVETLADEGGGGGSGGGGKAGKSKAKAAAMEASVSAPFSPEAMLPVLTRLQSIDLASAAALTTLNVDGGSGAEAENDGAGAIEIDWGGSADSGAGIDAATGTRNQLVDDLVELQAFLKQHITELAVSGAASALPHELQLDTAELSAWLAAVNAALEGLEDGHTRHLILLGTSDKYLERQVRQLEQMLDHAEKMRRRAEELRTRQAELTLTIESAAPKYEAVVGAIQGAKAEFEAALSKQLDGRHVNLMGDINSL